MPVGHLSTSLTTLQRVERSAGELSSAATRRMETSHEWYRVLSAQDRSWVGLVAQAGIAAFIAWLREGGDQAPVTADVFGTAPRELTRSITLRQTLDLVRSVVDVVEQDATALAEPGEEQALREAVLRYSREIAFSAAEVYAQAAEERGAWDARLEGLVVDAVLRGEADDSMQSRAAALGWGSTTRVAVVAGSTPPGSSAGVVDGLRRAAERVGVDTLAAVQGRRLVCIVGNVEEPLVAAGAVADQFGDGAIVVGPTVPHLFAAGRSARAALAGQACAQAWPGAPRPVAADDLLAERVLVGDAPARAMLLDRIWHPLGAAGGGALLETAAVYLEGGGGLEGTARLLFIHPNTVRYRLGRIAELTGYTLTDPHDAHTVRIALALGRLASATRPPARGSSTTPGRWRPPDSCGPRWPTCSAGPPSWLGAPRACSTRRASTRCACPSRSTTPPARRGPLRTASASRSGTPTAPASPGTAVRCPASWRGCGSTGTPATAAWSWPTPPPGCRPPSPVTC